MYISEHLFTSAPNCEKRLEKEAKVYDLLNKLNIDFCGIDHDHADTIEDCQKIEAVLGTEICKNLFLCNAQQTAFYLLLMPGKKPFKTKFLSKQIGSARLSFANAENMEKYLNITPGSVSVLGLMNDTNHCVRLLIDNELLNCEYIGCHPCINTTTLKIKTDDILNIFLKHLNIDYTPVTLPTEEQMQES